MTVTVSITVPLPIWERFLDMVEFEQNRPTADFPSGTRKHQFLTMALLDFVHMGETRRRTCYPRRREL